MIRTTSIDEVITHLKYKFVNVKFDDITKSMDKLKTDSPIGSILCAECNFIGEDVIDVSIYCRDKTHTEYIITLRRVTDEYKLPDEYIKINDSIVMTNNVEVYMGDVALTGVDVLYNDDKYMLEIPVCFNDIDYEELTERFAKEYGLMDILCSILNKIKDVESKLEVLEVIKEYSKG